MTAATPAQPDAPQNPTTFEGRHPWAKAFLAALRQIPNVTWAAKEAGVDRSHAYAVARQDPAFAKAWAEAYDLGVAALEVEVLRRAKEGVRKPLVYRGEVVGQWVKDGKVVRRGTEGAEWEALYEHTYSDSNAQFILRAARPEVYRDRAELRHTGNAPGGAIPVDVADPTEDSPEALAARLAPYADVIRQLGIDYAATAEAQPGNLPPGTPGRPTG